MESKKHYIAESHHGIGVGFVNRREDGDGMQTLVVDVEVGCRRVGWNGGGGGNGSGSGEQRWVPVQVPAGGTGA
ncbi:hypothetical protein GE21DRAFT_1285072 [Neurospora crassa]|nr:hypothetical protein GE21DRAFT_1285072 [Neurospora crassa]